MVRPLMRARGEEHVQPVFRVHPAPPPERLHHLVRRISRTVDGHGLDPEHRASRKKLALLDGGS